MFVKLLHGDRYARVCSIVWIGVTKNDPVEHLVQCDLSSDSLHTMFAGTEEECKAYLEAFIKGVA